MSSPSHAADDRTFMDAGSSLCDEALGDRLPYAEAPGVERLTRTRSAPGRWASGLGAVVLVASGAIWYGSSSDAGVPALRYATVERGDVTSSVTATGTLNAVTQVQVGTQVSGQVEAIYADFNDRVTAGELIARIDPTLLEQAVSDAEAGLERSQAALLKAERDHARNRQLFERQVLTETELNQTEYALSVAAAEAKSAQVALDRARRNLAYTRIYAPIDGVAAERNVDVGQTVAANFAAPQLFLIAQDLGEMEILAAVDESDIGEIRAGQRATFTVQAHSDTTFTGTVRQVRLQSATTENIVNYTAVVQVANPTGKLLPGMTATVSFLTGSAEDVLLVSNAALRYQPGEAVLSALEPTPRAAALLAPAAPPQGEAPAEAQARSGGDPGPPPFGGSAAGSRSSSTSRDGSGATLWLINGEGRLDALQVRAGVSDGRRTQVSGEGVEEGLRPIVGTGSAAAAASQASSPLQSGAQAGPRRPGF
ncbi:MAG: efflux RND transporter periplasmic adaptor subunit [Gemmatimonadetes bacterium]|nr:efflux RND transporter periplasmic adaptor subunit [Gemmatimonadota bacterium]